MSRTSEGEEDFRSNGDVEEEEALYSTPFGDHVGHNIVPNRDNISLTTGSNPSLHPSVKSEPVFLHETARVASIANGSSVDGMSLVSSPPLLSRGHHNQRPSTVQYKRTTTSVLGGFFGKKRTVVDVGAFRKMPNG